MIRILLTSEAETAQHVHRGLSICDTYIYITYTCTHTRSFHLRRELNDLKSLKRGSHTDVSNDLRCCRIMARDGIEGRRDEENYNGRERRNRCGTHSTRMMEQISRANPLFTVVAQPSPRKTALFALLLPRDPINLKKNFDIHCFQIL